MIWRMGLRTSLADFVNDIKLGGVTDPLEDRATVQNYLDKREKRLLLNSVCCGF